MEYTYEPYEEIEFPSALPPFDAGTLYSTSSAAGQNAFVYIFTEQTDCAHILKRSKQPASVKLIGRNRACLQRRKTASS